MSSSDEKMIVGDGTAETDAYEEFERLSKEADVYQVGEIMEPSQNNEEDPYSYNPFDLTQLPQTESEVKIAVEDLAQKLRHFNGIFVLFPRLGYA